MILVENNPLDTNRLAELFRVKEDLFLIYPKACHPFDHGQWRALLDPSIGAHSFFVNSRNDLVGHGALIRYKADAPGIVYQVGYLYFRPEFRSQGFGATLIGELEYYAVNHLAAEKLCLGVRDYNPRAYRCYLKCGFKTYEQKDTLIKMKKDLPKPRNSQLAFRH